MTKKFALVIITTFSFHFSYAQDKNISPAGEVKKTSLEENIGSAVDVAETKKHFFGVFGALGLPSMTSFGAAYYYGESRNVGIILQTGSGNINGEISYDNKYSEVLVVFGETAVDEWNKVGNFGFGQQDITVGTNYTDSNGQLYIESDKVKNTYFKMSLGMNKFYRSGFNWGFDFGFTFSLDRSSEYSSNSNAAAASIDHPTYGTIKDEYNLVHKLLAEGVSFQFNLIKVGWYF